VKIYIRGFYYFRGFGATAAAICLTGWLLLAGPAHAASPDFGSSGGPVHLIVGYQPYFTEGWSAVVMRGKKFYEKYLPKGSSVEFRIALQGSTIVNGMLGGTMHIGYLGDMPAIIATTTPEVADIRLVAVTGMGSDLCNVLLFRKDAPSFASANDAIRWLDGKKVAAPKGSCADRFAQALFAKANVTPASYKALNIEAIAAYLKEGKLDAAAMWEPTPSKLVLAGNARRGASGVSVNERDGGFVAMRADLIRQRPDVVKAWLQAELDAQLFLAEKNNAAEVVRIAGEQTGGFPDKALWFSLYGRYPDSAGGTATRMLLPYAFTPEAMELLRNATTFLYGIKRIKVEKLRPDAVTPEFALEVLKARKLTPPVGSVDALPDSAYKGG
jgi:NitT/TauT family transport system substrate-binding protein